MSNENRLIEKLLLESLYSLGDINGGLAHEINNPLTILIGQISLVKMMHDKGKLTPEACIERVLKIEDATQRVIKLVEKMRSIPRSVTEKDLCSNSLEKIIETNLFLIEYVCKKNNIEIDSSIEDCNLECIWEEVCVALKIILDDSITNIIQSDGESKKLFIDAKLNNKHCELKVSPFSKTSDKFEYANKLLSKYHFEVEVSDGEIKFKFPASSIDKLVA